jgi:hypothetical protein
MKVPPAAALGKHFANLTIICNCKLVEVSKFMNWVSLAAFYTHLLIIHV